MRIRPPVPGPVQSWSTLQLWLIVLVFALAWAAFGSPWLSGRVTIPYDARAHFQAQIQFLSDALHDGQSPFWTPNIFGGSPQIADPQSLIFSPALLLAWLVPDPSFRALDAFVFGLLGLGGLSIMMLFKDRGWHPAGAVVAGMAFAFGGAAAWRIQHVGQVMSFAQFAITLWLLARALDRSSIRYGLLAGLSGAMMVVKPDQIGLLGVYILTGYVLNHWLSAPARGAAFKASLRPLAAGAVAGLLLAGFPLLMTILFAEASQRSVISYSEAVKGSLHPAFLMTGVIADLFGAGDPKVDFWGPSSSAWTPGCSNLAQNMVEIYFGALPAIGILTVGITRGMIAAREIRFFTIAFGMMVIYALGSYTPGFKLFYDYLPGVAGFRRPADATFFIGGLGAIVGGYIVHRVMTDRLDRAGMVKSAYKVMVLLGAFALALGIAWSVGKLTVAIKPVLVSAGIALGGLALLRLLQAYGRATPVVASALLAGFMAFDLSINNGPNESTALSPASYDVLDPETKNSTIALLKNRLEQNNDPARRDRVEFLGVGFAWPNVGMIHGFDHVLGYNPLRLKEFVEASGAGDTIAAPEQRNFTRLMPSYRSRLADLMGLRWIASSVPIEQVDRNLRPGDLRFLSRTEDAYIYENPRALPRALFVRGWKPVDFDYMLATGEWPDFDPRREVLLDQVPETAQASTFSGPARVSIKKYENTRVEIEIDSPDAGFVVLNDVWHPWWTATVDGEEADILKANVLFRAVQVPAGKTVVVFEFKPIAGAIAEIRERLIGEDVDPEKASETP
jgi:hypothetical protein